VIGVEEVSGARRVAPAVGVKEASVGGRCGGA
jgi:hypothetical protein